MAIVTLLAKLVRMGSLEARQARVVFCLDGKVPLLISRTGLSLYLDWTIKTQMILLIDYVLQRSPPPEHSVLA